MSVAVIDDGLLGRALRDEDTGIAEETDLYTTGCWYVRLCQAALRGDEATGRLSGPFRNHPVPHRERTLDAVLQLPPSIGLLSMREIGRSMGRLRREGQLNLLGVEALAAARHLEAEVHLSAPSPRLEAALEGLGLIVRRHDAP